MTIHAHRVLSALTVLSCVVVVAARPAVSQLISDVRVLDYAEPVTPPVIDAELQARSPKSPGLSALISLFVTGGGQIYNEETVKGVIMLALGVGFTVLAVDGVDEYDCDPTETCYPWMLPVGLSGALAVKAWSVIDAAAGARRWNERHGLAALPVRPTIRLTGLGSGSVGVTFLQASF